MRTLRDELDEILAMNESLKPEYVEAYARNPATLLHSHFDWNNESAGYKHRLDQAARLIRAQIIHIDGGPKDPIRAYVSLPSDRISRGGYRPMGEILSDKKLAEEMLKAAEADLISWSKRYKRFEKVVEFRKVFAAARELERKNFKDIPGKKVLG